MVSRAYFWSCMASNVDPQPVPPPRVSSPVMSMSISFALLPLPNSVVPSIPPSASTMFSQVITKKPDDKKFLLWKQKIEPVIKGHKLHHYLNNPHIPPRFVNEANRDAGSVNPLYITWEQQDQLPLCWLQPTISSLILTELIGWIHSWHLWDQLHTYCCS